MIDERSLLAAIKDAWRTGGLLVVAPRRDDIEDALRQRLEQLPLA